MSGQIQETIPKYDTETQTIVHKMLVENTGCQPMYEGAEHYGWQMSRKEGDFRKTAYQKIEDKYGGVVKNIFHLINEQLVYDKKMDDKFHEFANKKDNKDKCHDNVIEEFCEKFNIDEDQCEGKCVGTYTYNYGTLLSRDIKQWNPRIDGKRYVIIQIHTGDDATKGFSTPHVFACEDYEDWLISWIETAICCNCTTAFCMDPDWQIENSAAPLSYGDGLVEHWDWKKDGKLHCSKCNCTIK